jgi:hypothetical protein
LPLEPPLLELPPCAPPPPPPWAQPKDMSSPAVRGTSRRCNERCMRVSPSDDWGRERFFSALRS